MYYFQVATKNFIWSEEEFQILTCEINILLEKEKPHQGINIGTSAEPAEKKTIGQKLDRSCVTD